MVTLLVPTLPIDGYDVVQVLVAVPVQADTNSFVGQLVVIHLHIFMYLELFLILLDRVLIALFVLILLFSVSAEPNPLAS